jgi:hypothetical protein
MLLTFSIVVSCLLFLAILIIGSKIILTKIFNSSIIDTSLIEDSKQYSQEELKQINESFEK